LETINSDISSKRKLAAMDGVKKSRSMLNSKAAKAMTASCREADKCDAIIETMKAALDPLDISLQDSASAFQGSEQERAALDGAYVKQKELAKSLTALEEQMVPAGYRTEVPDDYSDLPQLNGRATVEMSFKKPDGAPFNVNGVNYPTVNLVMIIDGYVGECGVCVFRVYASVCTFCCSSQQNLTILSRYTILYYDDTAPVTGGNFVDLVEKGFYTNMAIQRSDGFVVQTGDPDGEAVGYTGGKAGKALGAGKNGERLIPLEVTVKGDKGPIYEQTIEEWGRGGEATVLPFSSYGALGWAREEYDPNTGSSQFFWLLFDSDLTPAGKNLLDGNYPCFGYVVEGADLLADVKEGDIITSSKVTSGIENLKKGGE
jgi:peptidylprolyl isomerase